MCKQIKASDFRKSVIDISNGKDHNTIFEYLRTTGMVVNERNGILSVDENYVEKVKFFTAEIQTGDVVWNRMHGMLLVIDKRPAANADGHHYRALKVEICVEGGFRILGDERSVVIVDSESFRIRHTTFDIPTIDKLSYERYQAFCKITSISETLNKMKEKENG